MRDKKNSYFLLLSLIKKYDGITRTRLSNLTGLSNTSVGKITSSLMEDGWIIENKSRKNDVGRKSKLLSVNPDGLYSLGIEIEKEYTQIAIISFDGQTLMSEKIDNQFNSQNEIENYLNWLSQIILKLLNKVSQKIKEKIIAIGISVPGTVDTTNGIVINSSQLQWNNIELKKLMEEKLNYEVYVENHVRSILIAEKLYGNAKYEKDAVCIYIGSGVGTSVMVDGEVARGSNNSFGEIGHMIIDPNGPLCECGRLGCIQTYLSLESIKKQYGKSFENFLNDYYKGNKAAVNLVNKVLQYLNILVSNTLCMYNPSIVLLSGPLFYDFDIFKELLNKTIEEYIWSPLRDDFKIKNVENGRISAILGASSLVIDEFFKNK